MRAIWSTAESSHGPSAQEGASIPRVGGFSGSSDSGVPDSLSRVVEQELEEQGTHNSPDVTRIKNQNGFSGALPS